MTIKNKIASPDEAIALIQDGDTVCVSGFVGIGTPDELVLALQRRFLETGSPRDITQLVNYYKLAYNKRRSRKDRHAQGLRGARNRVQYQ